MCASKPIFGCLVSWSANVLSRVLPRVQHHAPRIRGATPWTKSDQEVLSSTTLSSSFKPPIDRTSAVRNRTCPGT